MRSAVDALSPSAAPRTLPSLPLSGCRKLPATCGNAAKSAQLALSVAQLPGTCATGRRVGAAPSRYREIAPLAGVRVCRKLAPAATIATIPGTYPYGDAQGSLKARSGALWRLLRPPTSRCGASGVPPDGAPAIAPLFGSQPGYSAHFRPFAAVRERPLWSRNEKATCSPWFWALGGFVCYNATNETRASYPRVGISRRAGR